MSGISKESLNEISEAVYKATFEQPVTEYECDLKIDGELKHCKIICLTIWADDDHSRRDGVVGKVFDAE